MILSYYDPISYTAKTLGSNSSEVLLADIFKNYTKYFKQVAKNYTLQTYYIQGSPRPEALSYLLYNNTQYYWALLMANNIYDPYHGWIKSQEACYQSVKQQYTDPEDSIAYHIDSKNEKYYNLIMYADEPNVWYDKGDKNKAHIQFRGALAAVSQFEHALNENEKKREIKIIKPGDMNNFLADLIKAMETNDVTSV